MSPTREKPTVLVVDDSAVIRKMIAPVVSKLGYRPVMAENGDEAIRQIHAVHVDALLLDISMPGRSGIEVLQYLRKNNFLLPVIMISGSGDISQAVQCIKLGAYEYLTKPVDRNRLEITLKNALSESALKEKVRLLSAAMDQSPIAVVITDTLGNIEYTNTAFSALGCLMNEKDSGTPVTLIKAEAVPDDFQGKLRETIASGQAWQGEFSRRCKNGDLCWQQAIISPVLNSAGAVSHVLALMQDITAVRNNQEALAESNKRFKELSDLLPQPVFETDQKGTVTYSNRAGLTAFGYTEDDLDKGINALRLFAPEERPGIEKSMRGREFGSHEYTAIKRDGRRFPVLVYSAPIAGKIGTAGLRGLVIDITERKEAEERVQENQKKYHNLFQAIPDAIIVADVDTGSLVEWNRQALLLFEYSPEELAGMTITGLYPQEFRSVSENYYKCALQQKAGTLETQIVTRHGLRIDVHISSSTFTAAGQRRFVSIIRDITEQKKSESLIRENIRLKNDFISTVSHELRTPLFSILGFTSTIMRDYEELDRDTMMEFLKIIHDESSRLSALIEDVLMISKIDSGRVSYKKSRIDPSSTLAEVCRNLKKRAEEKEIVLKLELNATSAEIYADPDALKQAAINLIGNALKFTPPGGRVSVLLSQNEEALSICVEDSGPGIPEADLEKIFEKFYRVNRPGEEIEGTGLGLHIVKEIIEAHQGTVTVTSRLQEGTTFTVRLPLIKTKTEAAA